MKEFNLVEETLNKRMQGYILDDKLTQMEQAANDEMFMTALSETMNAFSTTDAQWSEPDQ